MYLRAKDLCKTNIILKENNLKRQNRKLEIKKEYIKTVERIENKIEKELPKLSKIMSKKAKTREKGNYIEGQ